MQSRPLEMQLESFVEKEHAWQACLSSIYLTLRPLVTRPNQILQLKTLYPVGQAYQAPLYPTEVLKLQVLCSKTCSPVADDQRRLQRVANTTMMLLPAKITPRPGDPLGLFPVAEPPRYQLPMSVN